MERSNVASKASSPSSYDTQRRGPDYEPAPDNDRALGFDGVGWSGHETLAQRNFDLRTALADDLDFIARTADALCVLPGWEQSRGASAEVAVAHALDLPVAPLEAFDATGPHPDRVLQTHP